MRKVYIIELYYTHASDAGWWDSFFTNKRDAYKCAKKLNELAEENLLQKRARVLEKEIGCDIWDTIVFKMD